MKYYLMPEHFGVWSKLMMPVAGPPPMSFFITSTIMTLVTGISLAVIYYYLRNHLPKESKNRIFYFADLCIAFNFIFFILPSYLLFNLPTGLLVSWFISSFFLITLNSFILVKIIK